MDSDTHLFYELYPEDRPKKEKKPWVAPENHIANSKLAWSHHKENKKNIPTIEQVINRIKEVSVYSLRNAAFISILYLSGSRVHEVIQYKTEKVTYPGIRINDIRVDASNKLFFVIRSRVEKLDSLDWKQAFIRMDKSNMYYPLVCIINNYMSQNFLQGKDIDELTLDDYNEIGEQELFEFTETTARRIVRKTFGRHINLHIIRVWRAHHLAKYHQLTASQLKKYIGWRSMEMPLIYTEQTDEMLKEALDDVDEDVL